jgi:GcrA cell cycle regulator
LPAIWTVETNAKLSELWEAKYTCSECAQILNRLYPGSDLSKNAIAGKVRRLDLERRPGRNGAYMRGQPRAPDKPRKRIRKPPKKDLALLKAPRPLPEDEPMDENAEPITLLELRDHSCRWPIGSRPTLYCGKPVIEGRSYCGAHCRKAYVQSDHRPHALNYSKEGLR